MDTPDTSSVTLPLYSLGPPVFYPPRLPRPPPRALHARRSTAPEERFDIRPPAMIGERPSTPDSFLSHRGPASSQFSLSTLSHHNASDRSFTFHSARGAQDSAISPATSPDTPTLTPLKRTTLRSGFRIGSTEDNSEESSISSHNSIYPRSFSFSAWSLASSKRHEDPDLQRIKHLCIKNKIKKTEKIAYGGYSDVWVGMLQGDERNIRVAIKELRIRHRQGSTDDSQRLKKRFFREILMWDHLKHPHIVPLLGFVISDSCLPWLISPWYRNGNIVNYLAANPLVRRPPLLFQIANALQYLHSRSLVHGDLKGDNILIDDNGCALICDFGMSKFIDDALHITGFTTTAAGGGSARFLCPELLNDGEKTTMTDIWAFGCVVIQVMLDRLPYKHIASHDTVRVNIVLGEPPLPAEHEPESPFWNLIRRCWSHDPNNRPSITEILYFIPRSFPGANIQTIIHRSLSFNIMADPPPPRRAWSRYVSEDGSGISQVKKRSIFSRLKRFLTWKRRREATV
ncbi:hypothetical protein FRC03_004215 [Tulasnella sp. 419]|nr:hypothetical protein FRC03_004215 [Tulasnella sp. 419]